MNTTLTPADLDPRRQAMLLYFQGYRVARIAEMLGEKVATVHSWKKRDKWGDYGPLDQMQLTTAARYCQLIMKEHKEGKDFKEIDLLARQSERHARATTLALRWLVDYSRQRREKTMTERLANEILDASNGLGAAVKRREDMHKMAESNRAFAHYRW